MKIYKFTLISFFLIITISCGQYNTIMNEGFVYQYKEYDDTVQYINDEYRTGGSSAAMLGAYGRILVNKNNFPSFERIGLIPLISIRTKIRGVAGATQKSWKLFS